MRLASTHVIRGAGIAVFLVLALALYLSLTAGTGLPGQSFRTAHASFENVGGLRAGDDVRIASVRVGQVRSITYAEGKAKVAMQMDPGQRLYANAEALVVARSALGQNFVMLEPGSATAGALPQGGDLKATKVKSPVNLDEVLSVLDRPTRKATASLVYEAGTGAAGHAPDLAVALKHAPELLNDLRVTARTLADPATELDALLHSSSTLASRFDGRSEVVGELMTSLSETVEAVSVDGGSRLSESIEEADPALSAATQALNDLRVPLRSLDAGMRDLRRGAEALGTTTPRLRALLRDSSPVLDRVPAVAKQAVPAVDSLSEVVDDARPLADRLVKTLDSAQEPLAVLAPYTPELIRFFERWNSANRFSDASGHYLRIALVVTPETVAGILPVKAPLVHRMAYPAPGQADYDRPSGLLGGQ